MLNGYKILIVSGSDYTKQVYDAFHAVRDEGHELYLLNDGSFTPEEGVFQKVLSSNLRETAKVLDFVKSEGIRPDAVTIKTSEWLTPLVALLANHFGVIGNSPRTAFLCRSKYHMRKHMLQQCLCPPRFELCRNFDELWGAAQDVGFPCVAKPIGGNASYGTFLIKNESDKEQCRNIYENSIAYLKTLAVDYDVFAFSKDELKFFGEDEYFDLVTDYIVEEFLPGPEISLDSIVHDGVITVFGIADQVRMPPPYFVQVAEKMPYLCNQKVLDAVLDLNERALHAFEIKNSPVHLEIILSPSGPRIVELGCRMGGDNIHDSVFQITGYNLMYEALMVAMGVQRTYNIKTNCHTAMEYILPKVKGTIQAINIPESLYKDTRVTEVEISAKPGDKVSPPPESFDFVGYVQVRGPSPSEAEKTLSEVLEKVEVVVG